MCSDYKSGLEVAQKIKTHTSSGRKKDNSARQTPKDPGNRGSEDLADPLPNTAKAAGIDLGNDATSAGPELMPFVERR